MSSDESEFDEAAYAKERTMVDNDDEDDLESVKGAKAPRKPKNRSRKSVPFYKPRQSPIKSQNLPNVTRPARPAHIFTNALPSRDHRHRPGGIWYPPCGVVRLSKKPALFKPIETIPTTSIAEPRVERRTKKAWMYCVSPGPCWELLEDRAFFKEEYANDNATSRTSRPHVYSGLLQSRVSIVKLDATQARQYMPETETIDCLLGEHGSQTLHKLRALSCITMDSITKGDDAHVLYAGDPVTSVAWCPFTSETLKVRGGQQILAVCTRKADTKPKMGVQSGSPANIQLWSLQSAQSPTSSELKCIGILCIDEGPALQAKWCPLPTHTQGRASTKRLGIMAAVTMDGNAYIYSIPDLDGSANIQQVKIKPLVPLLLPKTTCQALDWANSQTIAVGGENGYIGVFDVKDALLKGHKGYSDCGDLHIGKANIPNPPVTMTHYFPVHQTCILAVAWVRAPPGRPTGEYKLTEDPTTICSTGTEGTTNMTDTRDCIPRLVARNREVPHACEYSTFCGAMIATDVDFWIKLYQMVPSMLGKGHSTTEIGGVALTLSCSDMHPLLAVGSADGACITTNLLRGTRREGAVPLLNHKLFQLDYSPALKQYRILGHFLPRESGVAEGTVFKESVFTESDQPKTGANDKGEKNAIKDGFESGRLEPSGLWTPSIAVCTVAWNSGNGLGNASLLASGTACGLVRIDLPEGAWMRGTRPYGSMAEIRFEGVEFANAIASDSD